MKSRGSFECDEDEDGNERDISLERRTQSEKIRRNF